MLPAVGQESSFGTGRSVYPLALLPHNRVLMLLPEHRSALEAIIAGIYDAIPRSSGDAVEPVPGIIDRLPPSPDSNGAVVYEQVNADIISCVRTQCSLQMRARNRAMVPPQCQLPIELWAAVFAKLARHDLVSASHVSRDWREAAVASSQLWTSPFFFSAEHATDCDCQNCSIPGPCQSCGSLRRLKHNPVDQVETFLARSGRFPVNLKLSVFSHATPRALADLNAVVQPHIHRIDSLSFYTSDIHVAEAFLQFVVSFSALKSLALELNFSGDLTWVYEKPVQMPELKSINIIGPLYCDHDTPFELRCTAVTSVNTIFYSASHLLPLLRTCPAVQHLQLAVGPRSMDSSTQEVLDEILALLEEAHPSEVHLTAAYEGDFEALLRLFNTTSIPNVSIAFANGQHLDGNGEILAQFLCAEVEQPVRLECVLLEDDTTDRNISFRLTTSNDTHERSCIFDINEPDMVLHNLWDELSSYSDSMKTLRISSFLWPAMLHIDEQPASDPPTATHVYIEIYREEMLVPWLEDRYAAILGGMEHILPQLEVLRFSLVTPQPLQLDLALVDAIKQAFHLKQKLQLLELEGFTLEGDLAVLDAVSHEVRIIQF